MDNFEFQFSVVSNYGDFDYVNDFIEYVEGIDNYQLMEDIVTDLLILNRIPRGVPHVKGTIRKTGDKISIVELKIYNHHDNV
jgi:hypothetical protein